MDKQDVSHCLSWLELPGERRLRRSAVVVTNQTAATEWESRVLSLVHMSPTAAQSFTVSETHDFFFSLWFSTHLCLVFDYTFASMLLLPHNYVAGMTLSRLWMDSCQDNSKAPAGPGLVIHTWAANAGMVVERIYQWLLVRSSSDPQCLNLIGVVEAAALVMYCVERLFRLTWQLHKR